MAQRLRRYLLPTLLAVACVQPVTSAANVIYTYTGNPYNFITDDTPPAGQFDTTMRVTGTFEVASALLPNLDDATITPLHFSFSNGRSTFTDSVVSSLFFEISTDGSGNIVEWHISLGIGSSLSDLGDQDLFLGTRYSPAQVGDTGQITECVSAGSLGCSVEQTDFARASPNPGVWTGPEAVAPVPATLGLLGLALAGLGWSRRKK